MPPTTDLSFTNLYKFVNKRVVKNNKAKYSEEKTKVVKKNDDAPIIEEWMSDNEEEDVSQPKIENKIIRPSNAKIEFVKSKQQEKTARKIIKQVKQHRKNTHKPLEYSIVEQGYEKKTFILDTKSSHDDGSKPSSDDGKKVDEDKRKENECNDQEKEDNVNSTNNVNTVSLTVNDVGTSEDNELLFDPNMPALEDASTFYFSSNNEDDGVVADINNLDTTVQVRRTQKDNACIERSKLNRGYTGRASTIQVTRSLKFSGFTKWKKGYRKIEEEVYVCQPPGFKDPYFPNRVYKVKKELYRLHQDPRAWFIEVKTASTPTETQKPLLKDEDGEEVDVHMYRSMIGSLMYLTSSRPDIVFVVYACARYQVNPNISHLHVVKRIFKYLKGQLKLGLWYPKDSPFDLVAYTDCDYSGASLDMMSTIGGCQFLGYGKKIIITESTIRRDLQLENAEGVDCLPNVVIFEQLALMGLVQVSLKNQLEEMSHHNRIYVIPSHTKKIFGNMKRLAKGFSRRDTPLFPTMMVQAQEEIGEGSTNPTDPLHTPTIIQPSTSQPQKKQKSRKLKKKDTELPQTSIPTSVADEAINEEIDDS
nr:uncharacterized mitochondrial protein AtMg00810-like [Tanacetum cinerariifolium]